MANTFICPGGHESTGESRVRQSCPKCGQTARRVFEDEDAESDITDTDGARPAEVEETTTKEASKDEEPESDKEQEATTESKRITKDKLRDQGPKRIKVRKREVAAEPTSTKAAGVVHRRVGKSKAFPVIKGKQRTHTGVSKEQDSRTAAENAETYGRKIMTRFFRI